LSANVGKTGLLAATCERLFLRSRCGTLLAQSWEDRKNKHPTTTTTTTTTKMMIFAKTPWTMTETTTMNAPSYPRYPLPLPLPRPHPHPHDHPHSFPKCRQECLNSSSSGRAAEARRPRQKSPATTTIKTKTLSWILFQVSTRRDP
jgi:hypothetical protein